MAVWVFRPARDITEMLLKDSDFEDGFVESVMENNGDFTERDARAEFRRFCRSIYVKTLEFRAPRYGVAIKASRRSSEASIRRSLIRIKRANRRSKRNSD